MSEEELGPKRKVRLLGGPRAHEELDLEEHITSICDGTEPLGVYKAIEQRWEDGAVCFLFKRTERKKRKPLPPRRGMCG